MEQIKYTKHKQVNTSITLTNMYRTKLNNIKRKHKSSEIRVKKSTFKNSLHQEVPICKGSKIRRTLITTALINSNFPLYGVQSQLHYQLTSSNAAPIEAQWTKLALSNLLSNFITMNFFLINKQIIIKSTKRTGRIQDSTKNGNKLTVRTLNI
jgi:hypothetical protein